MQLEERAETFYKMLKAELRNEQNICAAIGVDHPEVHRQRHLTNRAALLECVEYALCILTTIRATKEG